ncbi:polyprenyl synthetase family protein [Ruania zhangjianzhongii]|uniref:polyprenyl synthetase family protein n=1 Tax=Ruania zhangjianzhongii TaxID=2603206 RepID=UPI0011CBEB60|nr:polyprenyl synthetase family protein [Ruania zhangjianzhongii]
MSERPEQLEAERSVAESGRGDPSAAVAEVLREVVAQEWRQAAGHGRPYELLWRHLEQAISGGKHFRGRLVIETYTGLCGKDLPAAARLGAAFELLHAGFLVHDDLIDHDTLRRGHPNLAAGMSSAATAEGADTTTAEHLAEASAVLAGDLAIALAHRLTATVEAPVAVRTVLADLLWRTVFVSVAGELGDVAAAHGLWEVSAEQALTTAAEKTAFYSFQAPLRAGAVLAQAPDDVQEPLDRVGQALGKAFQLADDLLGVFAPEAVTGKSQLSDLREGKATTLMLYARELPVWDRIGSAVGRADLDVAAADLIRRELGASDAPARVDAQARHELVLARRCLLTTPGLEPVIDVVMPAWSMVADQLDMAIRYAAALGARDIKDQAGA